MGLSSVYIHDVEQVVLKTEHKIKNSNGYTRVLNVYCSDGTITRIALFSNDEAKLRVLQR